VVEHDQVGAVLARIVMWSLSTDVEPLALQAGGDGFISKAEPIDRLMEWLRAA
jgi:hypothetical protein